MKYRITTWLAAALMLSSLHATAASLSDIQVSNGDQQARITLSFVGEPEYSFTPQGKRQVALDIKQTGVLQGLPLQFSGSNLVKSIRAGTPQDTQTLRLLVDLTEDGKTRAVKQQNGANYTVVFTINADAPPPPPPPPVVVKRADPPPVMPSRTTTSGRNPFSSSGHERQTVMTSSQPAMTNNQTVTRPAARTVSADDKVIIAIDAGHGGQDPGAIGPNGTKEKNVTIAIARKLRALLNADPQFKPVLTRDGDYFISVMGRSDVARKQNANFLVSIHADAAPNRDATGASVWVLSNRRANSEMAGWLEQHEKQSELLGGAGDVLANSQADPYLSQAVLDLQFGHSQRVGYDVATNVLASCSVLATCTNAARSMLALECCARRTSRRSSWKRALSVTTAKSGCWVAMITRSRLRRRFITAYATTLCSIRCSRRLAARRRRPPAPRRRAGC